MNVFSKFILTVISLISKFLQWLIDWLRNNPPGPHITSVTPSETYPGSVVDIAGGGFSPTLNGNTVTIGGQPARVIQATATTIKAIISLDAQDGPITVVTGGSTLNSPVNFKARPYPLPGSGEDGPPAYFEGAPNLSPGDVPSTGTLRVLVVLVNPTDVVPANPANSRTDVSNKWANVHTYYDQASFNTLNVQVDLTTNWTGLLKNKDYYVDSDPDVNNIKQSVLPQLWAEAAQIAVNDGKTLNNYAIMAVVMFLNGEFIRAWGGASQQNFNYTDAPSGTNINLSANHQINLLAIQESADWGRFAHETGHNIVSAPSFQDGTIGTATLGEDVYQSDLVDPNAATAREFDIMGSHDDHPLFSAYHMEKLGYYAGGEILNLQWDRNAFSQDIDVVAHGLTKALPAGRYHLIKIKVADGLMYYVEVRQRPGATAQVFDSSIPIGPSANQGGVIVTEVLMDTMNNNQQTRFITLLSDPTAVMIQGQSAIDPARALNISVVNDNLVAHPQVCRVRVAWAQGIADDPNGAFDLNIAPWNDNYETPDIWIDRPPYNTFDNPNDADGRPTGNGDKPQPLKINKFNARVHNQGTVDATNVQVTFYTVTPPGVGDNGNWTPLKTVTVAQVNKNGFFDTSADWVPVVGEHTCLKVFVNQQLGEITGGNNWAQENVFEFTAAASIPEPQIIRVAVRNPRKEDSLVYVALQNVPYGYVVQFPNQWLMMKPLEERIVDMVIVPHLDITAYEQAGKDPKQNERRTERSAAVRVVGTVPREYTDEQTVGQVVGSRMFHIGGILTRVTPKRHSVIKLERDDKYNDKNPYLGVRGGIGPAQANQTVTIYVTDPKNRQRAMEVKTDAQGGFSAVFDLTAVPSLETPKWQLEGRTMPPEVSNEEEPVSGVYEAQALLFSADDVAESESNIVKITKTF